MSMTIDNKTFRNLEEQVLKNKEDIAKHYEIDRVLADWGIKVIGVVATINDIPEGDYQYGDSYGLSSTSPMQYVIWTRSNPNVGEDTDYWLNVGALSLVGPQGAQGIQGIQGIQGVRGSKWTSSTSAPTATSGYNMGDQWLNTTTGDVYEFRGNTWARLGNIKGPQGVQGPIGPKGDQGIQGPTGSQGPKGDTGSSFTIAGLLNNAENLPTPTEANRHKGYAVKNADNVTYDLYVVVGEAGSLQWVNMGRVEGVEGPQGPVGPQGPAGADIQIVHITGIPSTATQGNLTQDQVNTLLAHPGNYIQFFNENFYPQDVEIGEGYIVYSHVGQIGSETKIKNINLTIATGSWVLTETSLVSAPITIVNELPEANEENFEKGKIYTTGELLQYLAKVALTNPNISQVNTLANQTKGVGAARVGTKIYLFGGYKDYGHLNGIYEYDISLNSLTKLNTVMSSGGFAYVAAVPVGTKIYLFGGLYQTTIEFNYIQCFDTITKTLENVTSMALEGRVIAAAVGTNIYYFQNTAVRKFDTLTNQISYITELPTTISDAGSISAVGDNIYLFYNNNIIKFNTQTNVGTLLDTQFESRVVNAAAQAIGEDIYIFGGLATSSSASIDRIIKFSTSKNTYEILSAVLPQPIKESTAVSSYNDIYIFGGYNNSSLLNTIYQVEFGFTFQYKTIATE